MFMYKLTLFVYIILFYCFYEYMRMRYNLSRALLLFERMSIDYEESCEQIYTNCNIDDYTIICNKAVYLNSEITNKTKYYILDNLDYCKNEPFLNKESNYDYFSNNKMCFIFLNTTKNALTDMIFNYC